MLGSWLRTIQIIDLPIVWQAGWMDFQVVRMLAIWFPSYTSIWDTDIPVFWLDVFPNIQKDCLLGSWLKAIQIIDLPADGGVFPGTQDSC